MDKQVSEVSIGFVENGLKLTIEYEVPDSDFYFPSKKYFFESPCKDRVIAQVTTLIESLCKEKGVQ